MLLLLKGTCEKINKNLGGLLWDIFSNLINNPYNWERQ